MRFSTKVTLLATSMTLALITGLPAVAFGARNSHAVAETSIDTTSQQADSRKPEDVGNKGKNKSQEDKLKGCQRREKVINDKLSRIADRGQRQLDLFTSIAEKTEKFYTDKGRSVSNYDALVADVAAKKADAKAAVDAVKASSVSFKCDGTDPKGAVAGFKDALKTEIAALKAYKTSVKNLIVGVKSANGETTSQENKTTDSKTTETKPTQQTTTGGAQ